MELSHLRTFLTVAKHHSLTKAAAELHLSQPAITRQLQRLEEWAGFPLFERRGRSTELTVAGKSMQPYAEQAIQALDNCLAVLTDLRLGRKGRLALGAGLTTATLTLPSLIQQYKKRLPDIELSVQTGTTQEILQLILEEQIDLGFVTSPTSHPACLVRPLYNDEIIMISDATLPLAGISISLSELANLPLILYTPSGFRDFVENTLRQVEVTPKIAMELDTIEGIKRMVAANVGYAFVPRSAVREELERGSLVEVPVRGLPQMFRQTSLIRLKRKLKSPAVQTFLEVVEQQLGHSMSKPSR